LTLVSGPSQIPLPAAGDKTVGTGTGPYQQNSCFVDTVPFLFFYLDTISASCHHGPSFPEKGVSSMEVKSGAYIRKLVITGALGALAVFLGITRLGFFPWFSGASITILHIPAIIGAILEGPIVGIGIGTIFGIFSLIQANLSPVGADALFRDPLVSVLPRVLFPLAAWGIYFLLSKWKKIPAVIVASVGGAIIHTVLVLGMIILTHGSGVFTGGKIGTSIWPILGGIFVLNGLPEAAAAGILTTLVVAAWLGISTGSKKSKLSSEK
jgi:uncharacterized membrane protein